MALILIAAGLLLWVVIGGIVAILVGPLLQEPPDTSTEVNPGAAPIVGPSTPAEYPR
jgi:hypothetical protein